MTHPTHATAAAKVRTDPVLIGLAGLAGSGKTTMADRMQLQHGFEQLAFADVLKEMLEVLLNTLDIDYAVLYEPHLKETPLPALFGLTPRQLMQSLGDWGRGLNEDLWVKALAHRAGLHDLPNSAPVHDRIVVSDVRYPNEAKWLADMEGALVCMVRPPADGAATFAPAQHTSEAHAHLLPADAVLLNNALSVPSLHARIDTWLFENGLTCAENAAP